MAKAPTDVSSVAIGAAAAGMLLLWSGIKGSSVLGAVQDIIKGHKPSDTQTNPIDTSITAGAAGGAAAGLVGATASGSAIVAAAQQVAASPAGRRNYCWGGGHTSDPCSANCFDCSGYVSCVLNRLGLLHGSMVTTGFMVWSGALTIPYAQRAPGDLLVSPTHMGIIADSSQFWNAACTACGPVKLQSYVGRSGYIVRRVRAAAGSGAGISFNPSTTAGR